MIKNKIFKYFFLEFLKLFILISLSLSLIIWISQATRLLELVTEYGNPISVYLQYIILSYPKILNNLIILTFPITMFFLFSKLESANELGIYWLSGIEKKKIIHLTLYISFLVIIFHSFLSVYFAPNTSFKGRQVLANAEFSIVNTLVKENNFNSPLKGLTIFVKKNDKKGNLEGVSIFEKDRTILAKKGLVITKGETSFLVLINGVTHEKIGNKVNIINFEETIFDFSKYKIRNTDYAKFNERNIKWLIKNINNQEQLKLSEIREEINERLFKPFFILIMGILSCFLLYNNNEKINLKKLRILIYCFSIILIIFNQILIASSGKELIYSGFYIIIIFSIFLTLYLILNKILKQESI